MIIIFLIILVFLLIFCPAVRCAVFHPFLTLKNAVVDLYNYIKYKKRNELKTGELVAYTGLFGKGKTLSAVHAVVSRYEQYNGKKVWCNRRNRFVEQRVQVLSNVDLKTIPYIRFESLQQIVDLAKSKQKIEDELNVKLVTLVLGDEFSVQMNSRSFKTNIDHLFLNTILTCRHYDISLFYTTQRFHHVDALLRQVTSRVADCNKLWRFQRISWYDAWELENSTNVANIRPLSRGCWFVTNKDYSAYDTMACVDNLSKKVKDGDMLTETEIHELLGSTSSSDMNAVSSPSHRFMKRMRKMKK